MNQSTKRSSLRSIEPSRKAFEKGSSFIVPISGVLFGLFPTLFVACSLDSEPAWNPPAALWHPLDAEVRIPGTAFTTAPANDASINLIRQTQTSLVARKITDSQDLIGGLRAAGREGDYYLANDRIRLIIQDIDHGAQFYIFGGNIIDADVVRASGEAGLDLLGEFFVDMNLTHALEPTSIEVISDGSDGQEARIRVTGIDFPWPLLPPKEPVEALETEITQDYVLLPGDSFVTIETTVKNVGASTLSMIEAEVLLIGSSTTLNVDGLPPDEMVGSVQYLVARGTETVGASYLFAPEQGRMSIVFEDAAQTGALLGSGRILPGQNLAWRRLFFVGDRDSASVTDAFFDVRGQRTGTLSGHVQDKSGKPVEGAWIQVLDLDGNYLTECLSRSDGSFEARVPPGDVMLNIEAVGRNDDSAGPITVNAGNTTEIVETLQPQGLLQFNAVDEAGHACPVRATFVNSNGNTVYQASHRGGERVALPPATYSVTLSRGIEYGIATYSVTVPEDGSVVYVPSSGAAVLKRVVDTEGWLSGDFHLHQKNSDDSWTLFENRVISLLAEGIEVGVPTDHDHVSNLEPTIRELGVEDQLITAIGNEVSIVDYGHFNYFPIPNDSTLLAAANGTKFYFSEDNSVLSASELFAKMRSSDGEKVVQVNHPRDDASGYLNMIAYNPNTGLARREVLATDFDAIEVKNDVFGEDSILPDYFSLIDQGLTIAAMGNSDAHRGRAENGYPRTYLRVTDDRTAVATFDNVVDAIRGAHTSVSSGIFVNLTAKAGAGEAGPGDVLPAGNNPVNLEVRLQCPAWTAMHHFTLYANGFEVPLVADGSNFSQDLDAVGDTVQDLHPQEIAGRYEQTFEISVTPGGDTYYLLLAWGDGNLAPVSGDPVLGYTSPVYVDVNGAGFLAPGRGKPVGKSPAAPAGYQKSPDRCGSDLHSPRG